MSEYPDKPAGSRYINGGTQEDVALVCDWCRKPTGIVEFVYMEADNASDESNLQDGEDTTKSIPQRKCVVEGQVTPDTILCKSCLERYRE